MDEAQETPGHRRSGMPRRHTDRPMSADVVPQDWPAAQPVIAGILTDHDARHDEHDERGDRHEAEIVALGAVATRLDAVASQLADLAKTVQAYTDDAPARAVTRVRVNMMWAFGVLTLGAAVTGVTLWGVRSMLEQHSAAAVPTASERISAIADIMSEIPRTPTLRLQTGPHRGAPTVRAVQARAARLVPPVRGVTMIERDEACLLVPAACAPP